MDDLRRVRHGALLLGEGDLGDAREVAQVHDALQVVVVGRHRARGQREEVQQAEFVGGGRCRREGRHQDVHSEIFAFAPLRGAI